MNTPVSYYPNFIVNGTEWFDVLQRDLAWERRPDSPRHEYWQNGLNCASYTYGRGAGIRTYESKPTHALIEEGRERIKSKIGSFLEGCFLNMYGTSRDWLGWHADDDLGIDHSKPIAVITLGQARRIEYREITGTEEGPKGTRNTYGPTDGIMLENGSLFLMHAGMQQTHDHRIPKASFEAKPRISMTYRGLIA